MAAGYRWFFGDLRTGKIWRQVDLKGSWSNAVDGTGSLSGSFPLRSGEWPTAGSDISPGKAYLAVAYVDDKDNETFLEGGPLWTSDYDDTNGTLQADAGALWTYYDHRKLIQVLAANQNAVDVEATYSANQLGLIAKRLIELAHTHTGGAPPIVLPSDADLGGAGSAHSRTYPGYELGWVGERLRQLTEGDEGPEIQFVPRRRSDDPRFLEWVMRIGTEPDLMLTQSGPAWVFDRTVRKSPIAGINVKRDGTKMTFRSWAAGQGQAEGRPIVAVEDLSLVNDYGFALLESEASATDSVSSTSILQSHATLDLLAHGRQIETWTMRVARDGRPNVGQIRVGDWCTARVKDHVFIPDGNHELRIVGVSGETDNNFVELQMAPRIGTT